MITQRLLNRFPLWTKARNDPSSFANRLFSTWGEYFDWSYADLRRRKEDTSLYKEGLGIGKLHVLSLLEEDFMTYDLTVGGIKVWVYPVLTGDTLELTRVTSLEELMYGIPSRLGVISTTGVNNLTVYADDRTFTPTIADIEIPERLCFEIVDSTNYYKRTSTRNTRSTGKHQLIVVGYDHNDIQTREVIDFPIDGYYKTKNVFKKLTEVIPEGTDGEVYGRIFSDQLFVKDNYRIAVSEEQEGPQYLRLSASGGQTLLQYETLTVTSAEEFMDGTPEVPDNSIELWQQYLLNVDQDHVDTVSAVICPNTTRLWTVDTAGVIHVYEHQPNSFVTPVEQSALTFDSYLEIIPVKHYSALGESIPLFTRWAKTTVPLVYVSIWRIDPAGTKTHLQIDKTWGPTQWKFYVKDFNTLVEETWKDFSFNSTQDQLGQWEFYVETATRVETTRSWTGILVDSLVSVADFPTEMTNIIAINFSKENYVCVTSSANFDGKANTVRAFKPLVDNYLCDPANQTVYLKETYASVDVTYE